MNCKITTIPGDGIGPEIVREACRVLDKAGQVFGHTFTYTEVLMGGCSIDKYGVPLTEEALETAKNSDAVLLGAVGGNVGNSRWYDVAPNLRPEAGLLAIRKGLNLFANIRPAYLYQELADACPLKKEIIGDGFDMVIMRELTGGLYFGERHTEEVDGVLQATDTLTYNENEIRRIAVKAFDIAMKRKKHVISVDKANVLDSSRLWRKVVEEVANVQACLGLAQLERLEGFVETKKARYNQYKAALDGVHGLRILPFKEESDGVRSNHWFYSLYLKDSGLDRDTVIAKLQDQGIQTRPVWALINEQADYPKNEAYALEKAQDYRKYIVNLPCSTNLTEQDCERVIAAVKNL